MSNLVLSGDIQDLIFTIRGVQVMIDRDLADMYGVDTKVLNQAVKRNLVRFPSQFRFQLDEQEKIELVTNCDRFEKLKHSSVNPYAFTEQGISMLSAVLHSETAIKVSIRIVNAFVEMRKFIHTNAAVFHRLGQVEQKQFEADQKFEQLFKLLDKKVLIPQQGVFFDGQIFDAHKLMSEIVRSAKQSIVLIDNYVDDTVLDLFSKKDKAVNCTIFTQNISKQLQLDATKFDQQYPSLVIKSFKKSHDRFLIIDQEVVYHVGASLKDLGKKWFAFSKLDAGSVTIIDEIKKELL